MSEAQPCNCSECGRLVPTPVRGLCAECLRLEHDELARLRAYLREHPEQIAAQISDGTQIPIRRLLRWLREGRLETSRPEAGLTCEHCGRKITAGRLCVVCYDRLQRVIQQEAARQSAEVAIREAAAAAREQSTGRQERRERRRDDGRGERFDLR